MAGKHAPGRGKKKNKTTTRWRGERVAGGGGKPRGGGETEAPKGGGGAGGGGTTATIPARAEPRVGGNPAGTRKPGAPAEIWGRGRDRPSADSLRRARGTVAG